VTAIEGDCRILCKRQEARGKRQKAKGKRQEHPGAMC